MSKKVFVGIAWVIPILYVGLIWFLSSRPSNAVVNTGLSFDNTLKESAHFIEFAVLYLLMVGVLRFTGRLTAQTNKIAMLIAILAGFMDELHQYYVPYRSATLVDLVKDTSGVLIAWYLVNYSLFVKRQR